MVEGEISLSLFLIAARSFSAVEWTSSFISQYLSVFAVHRMISFSNPFFSLNSFICFLTVSSCSCFVPGITLSALVFWLGATKEGSKIAGRGTIFSNSSLIWWYIAGSMTLALFVASYMLALEISHPPMTRSLGSTMGRRDLKGAT